MQPAEEQEKQGAPLVSVLVPARDEEHNIAHCLSSLLEQNVEAEILVADDGSTDRTAAIVEDFAALFPSVRLISVPPLQEGWIGKTHALHVAAQYASSEWLLFTDADTRHVAGKLRGVIERAEKEGLDMLSYSPRQETRTWWEKAVIPGIYRKLSERFPFERVNDPRDAAAAANGQYILIRKKTYQALGGHRAVRYAIVEDVELARRVKQAGRRVWFGPDTGVVSTRMYRSFPEMWEGWTKNLFLLYGKDRGALWRDAVGLSARFLLPAAAGMGLLLGSLPLRAVGLVFLLYLVWQHVLYWKDLTGTEKGAKTLYLLPGVWLIVLLLLNSDRHHSGRKNIQWKGRYYRAGA